MTLFAEVAPDEEVFQKVLGNWFLRILDINIGERSGSGVPNIFNTWKDEGWVEPMIEEQFDPDRTILTLKFKKQAAIKSGDKKRR